MKRIFPAEDWPESWKLSYTYDLIEVYGDTANLGYTCAYALRRKRALAMVANSLIIGQHILDIAAAQGNFSLTLAETGYVVTWNDIREDLADYVRSKYESGTIDYAPGNVLDISFPDLFDAVLITEVIEHVAHPDRFLAHVATLVRPGGFIIMTTPNGAYFRNPLPRFSSCPDPSAYESIQFKPNADGHIFLLHPDEIPELAAQAGLSVESLTTFNSPLASANLNVDRRVRRLLPFCVNLVERLTDRLPLPIASRLLVQMAVLFRKPLAG